MAKKFNKAAAARKLSLKKSDERKVVVQASVAQVQDLTMASPLRLITQDPSPRELQEGAKCLELGISIHEDHNHKTALVLERTTRQVTYVFFTPTEGLYTCRLRAETFQKQYTPLLTYPVARAVRRYLDFATRYGATDEVLSLLGRVIPPTESEQEAVMAAKKSKAEGKVKMTSEVKEKLTKAKAEAKAKAPKEPKEPRVTAAGEFKRLIMGGTFSDEVIFKKVQEKFGLSDDKKGYVKWYRNQLKKKGEKNVPEPKGA